MTEYVIPIISMAAPYGLTIHAEDKVEASRRLRAIGMTGTVEGTLVAIIQASPVGGILARAICAVRNMARATECR